MQAKTYKNFKQFYPFYLSQHSHKVCKLLHIIGSTLVLLILGFAIITQQFLWLWALPILGYGFAWVGHFVFEKNKPATFTYPLYSFMSDWLMWWQVITLKIKI